MAIDPAHLGAMAGGGDASLLAQAIGQAQHQVLRLILLVPRPYVLFLVVPYLSRAMIPGGIRRGLVFMVALLTLPLAADPAGLSPPMIGLLMFKEGFIGLLLGLGLGVFVWAVQSVGDLVDFHTGAANARFFDPAFGHEGGPTGAFLGWLVAVLFVSSGGLLGLLGLLVESYRVWPQADFAPDLRHLVQAFAIHQGDQLFAWIVKLGAPVLLVLMLVDMGLGLIGRFVPQLNIFVIAQPLKSLVAIFMLLISLGLLGQTLAEFLRPDLTVLRLLRPAGP